MLGLLDLLPTIPAPNVCCDHDVTVEDAHGAEVGEYDEGALRAVVRYRVVVEVEPDVRRLADLDLEPLVRRKGLRRERKESASLFLEGVAHRAVAILDPRTVERDGRCPFECLAVEVGEVDEGAGLEECFSDIPNRTLDPALL